MNSEPRTKNKNGFTIVELLIAMGVFVVLLTIMVNIFIGSLKTQRSMVALMLANDSASLVLEQMAREIRTGENFSIPSGVSGDELRFKNANGQNVVYKFNAEAIERGVGGLEPVPITGKNVNITRLNFNLVHQFTGFGQNWPPRITITLEVKSKNLELQSISTAIQTTVSARNL